MIFLPAFFIFDARMLCKLRLNGADKKIGDYGFKTNYLNELKVYISNNF
jgi:hypothetical protein